MHISDKSLDIPRRTFLRGIGVSLALPMLECMLPAATHAATAFGPPRRLVFVYLPNGMHMPDWTPKAAGTLGELPPTLQALAPFKSNFQVLSGLAHVKARALG